jgi:hypothetical protein
MTKKLRRFSINVEPDLEALILAESKREHIPVANVIVRHLYARYETLEKQAGLFSPPVFRAPLDEDPEPVVFETPQDSAQGAKSRAISRRVNNK